MSTERLEQIRKYQAIIDSKKTSLKEKIKALEDLINSPGYEEQV